MPKKIASQPSPVHILIVGLTVTIILLGLILTGIKIGYKQAAVGSPTAMPTPSSQAIPAKKTNSVTSGSPTPTPTSKVLLKVTY